MRSQPKPPLNNGCGVVGALVLVCVALAATAQQKTPPTPAAPAGPLAHQAAKVQAAPQLSELAQHKAELFKGLTLSEAQKTKVIGNLHGVGCQPMMVAQQTMPVPPGRAAGEACTSLYAGSPGQLVALRVAHVCERTLEDLDR